LNSVAKGATCDRRKSGWLESFKPPHVSFAHFLRERLRVTIRESHFEPLEVAYGAGCAYIAIKVSKPAQPAQVRAVVAQVEHLTGLPGSANIAWRILDEDSLGQAFTYSDGRRSFTSRADATFAGVFNHCPRTILEKLTDTGSVSALAWRRACWSRVADSERRGRRPLARGDIATFREPIKFSDGLEREAFLVTQSIPLHGIAFGVGPRPMRIAHIERLLIPVPTIDLEMTPDDEHVEILTASKGDCVGYLIRTTETKKIVGATSDPGAAIAFERRWNMTVTESQFDANVDALSLGA